MSLRYLYLWQGLGILWIALVVYLSLTPSPAVGPVFPGSDKLLHGLTYAVLGVWYGALCRSWGGCAVAVAALVALGGGLELAQGMGASRHAESGDLVADALGVVVGILFGSSAVGPALRRFEERLP